MSEARRHHYVPRFYLAGFTEEGTNDGRLNVLNLYTGKTWISTPNAAANDRDFYRLDGLEDPLIFEKLLGTIEGSTKKLITAIEAASVLPDPGAEDFLELMIFVTVMFVRVPRRRTEANKVADGIARRTLRDNVGTPDTWDTTVERLKAKGLGDFSGTDYAEWKSTVERGDFKIDMSRNQHIAMMMTCVENYLEHFAGRKWHLQMALQESGEFVCSDSPVMVSWSDPGLEAKLGTPGLVDRETEITMPLTRSLAIRGRFEGQNASAKVSRRIFATTNDRTMFLARQVYSASEEFPWLMAGGHVGSRADVLSEIEESTRHRREH